MAVTLLTTLLSSTVLASPEVLRQSPAQTWRQLTTPGLLAGQLPGDSPLIDCP